MHIYELITIAPASGGGFIITCREKRIKNQKENMSECSCEVPYVAKDINSAMKIIRGKLEECSKEMADEDKNKGVMKNAY